jgi:cytochrome b
MQKSYIWSISTRVFHALFALSIFIAFISAQEKQWLNFHVIIGYSILILLIFRLFWGIFGPKHSLFKDLSFGKKNIKEFLNHIFEEKTKYAGHNPLASYVIISMLLVAFLAVISGSLAFGIQEGKGIFSFLNTPLFKEMDFFGEIHEFFSTLFIALIVAHILGIFVDRLLHKKQETLNSIITGYKITQEDESIKLNIYQKIFSLVIFIFFVGFLVFNFYNPKNILVASKFTPIDYKVENQLFVKECASCHTLYPPNLLPKKSWELLMSDLENHFGDDASIPEDSNKEILAFLVKNSAENSTMQSSFKFLNSIKNQDIITMTKTTFWEKTHKEIPKEIFENSEVKSKANCKACHSDIEKGLIENENIKNLSTFK